MASLALGRLSPCLGHQRTSQASIATLTLSALFRESPLRFLNTYETGPRVGKFTVWRLRSWRSTQVTALESS